MKKSTLKNACGALALLGASFSASATITTYTDHTAWAAASGASTLYDFNSDTAGSFTSKDFGDFTGTMVNLSSAPRIESGEIKLQTSTSNSALKITFDSSQSAFGFDWRNTDPTGDKIEINILGQNFIFGSRGSGFFGLTSTTLFTEALFGDSAGNGGALTYGYLDNFEYNANPSAVPVPAAVWLMGSGLLGLMGFSRKNKKLAA